MDFYKSMGAVGEERTELQLTFLYFLKHEINEELEEIRKQQKMERKYNNIVYFENDDEDGDPLE